MEKNAFLTAWVCLCAAWAFAAPLDSTEITVEMPEDTVNTSVNSPQNGSVSEDSLSQIDKMPELKEFVKADYPADIIKKGIQGVVLLELLVNETGGVDSVRVVKSLDPKLDSTACEAAKKFKFTPAVADSQQVAVLLQYEYRFTLEEAVDSVQQYVNFEGTLIERGTRKPISDAMMVVTFVDSTSDTTLPVPFSEYLKKIGKIEGQTLEENKIVALTDSAGNFKFYSLPACSINVAVVIPGYEAYTTVERITKKEALQAKYYVKRYSYSEYEIVVYGKAEEKEVSKRQLTVQEIQKIPGLGGDAVKVVQAMPGVARAQFGSGAVIVRGAPTWDSKFYLDGVEIPVLYHFGGLKSAYNSEALKGVDFLPGGFGSRYGGAIAGTIELNSREAAKDRWHGTVDLSTIDGSFQVEGPINEKVSLLVNARRSFIGDIINWASKKYDDYFPMTISTFYWDYVLRTDYHPSKNNHLFLTLFGSSDSMAIIYPDMRYGSDDISEQTDRFGMNSTFNMGLLGWDWAINDRWSNNLKYSITRGRAGVSPFGFMKSVSYYTTNYIRDQLSYRFNDKLLLNLGPDIELSEYDMDMKITDAKGVIQHDKDTDWLFGVVGVYLNFEWKPTEKVQIIPGIRYDYYPELEHDGTVAPEFWDYQSFDNNRGPSGEPSLRLNGRYNIVKDHIIKASIGNYNQSPRPLGQVIHKTWGDPTMPTTKAVHYVLGHEWQITDLINSDVQVYFNNQWNIPQYADNSDSKNDGSGQKLWLDNGRGRMYGLEVMLRHLKSDHFFGWVAYTLSRTERYDRSEKRWKLFGDDETHNLQVLGSWHLKKEWDLGFRARFVSGKPTTPIDRVEYVEEYLDYLPKYGKENSERLDPFFQLDLRVDKKFVFDKWMYSFYLDLQNLSYFFYKSPEFEYYDYNYKEKKTVSSFPMLGIGYKAEF